ncbi:MAG: thiol peroxidase [Bacteroidales bacterium]
MAIVTLKGTEVHTLAELPKVGTKAPKIELVKADLSEFCSCDVKGKKVLINIFPSLDTDVCATSVRKFNKEAAKLENVVVLCVSKDLPFAAGRFCTTEGIKNVITLSGFRDCDCSCTDVCDCSGFGAEYGVTITDGPLKGLYARAVVVLDEDGVVQYEELVPEITHEPDYQAALDALK